MKTSRKIKRKNLPSFTIDKSLDKYDNTVLFPKKLAHANKMLKTIGLPESKKIK